MVSIGKWRYGHLRLSSTRLMMCLVLSISIALSCCSCGHSHEEEVAAGMTLLTSIMEDELWSMMKFRRGSLGNIYKIYVRKSR